MDNLKHAEQFWPDGRDALQSSTGENNSQPETNKTSIEVDGLTFGAGLHGLCRWCGSPVYRNGDGFWTHTHGVLCEGGGRGVRYREGAPRLCIAEPIGIDMPGVGVVASYPESSPDCTGRENAGDGIGERSPDLVAGVGQERRNPERRERLFLQLVFAAKDLADAQIEPVTGAYHATFKEAEDPAFFCTECWVGEREGAIRHESVCRTGRVQRVLADLVSTVSKSDLKEAAGDGELPEAGDGIRPRGPSELVVWLEERKQNCLRIAATRQGTDRDGWLIDAGYFGAVMQQLGEGGVL